MELLLSAGSNPLAVDHRFETPLHEACKRDRSAIVCALLKHGSNVHMRNCVGDTALHVAVRFASIECVRMLLWHGGSVSMMNNHKQTPLHIMGRITVFHKALLIDQILSELLDFVEHPDVLNLRDSDGQTVLHETIAIGVTVLPSIRRLLDAGADFTMHSGRGESALDVALKSSDEETRRLGEELLRSTPTRTLHSIPMNIVLSQVTMGQHIRRSQR